MSKRAAAIQLTSDNYELDDKDSEEPGRFEQASEDQLKQRVIKKAARRTNAGSGMANGSTGGLGAGLFAGLKTSTTPSFGFGVSSGGLSGLGAGTLGRAPLSSVSAGQSNTMTSFNKKPATMEFQSNGVASSSVAIGNGGGSGSSEYWKQLQALNVGVSKWISSHVDKNPHVDLTPIFRDYEKHLKAIDMKYKPLSETESSQESDCGEGTSSQTTPFSQGEESDYHGDSSSQVSSQGTATEEYDTAATTGGEEEDTEESSSKQLQLASSSSSTTPENVDDGSLLSLRAKLFYKKQDEYTELGVGTLKVQSSNGQSVCLLLRNDTSIGNILMNVRVTGDVPMTLTKNNLIVVCPANPPLGKGEGGMVTYLIRVKTAQLAEKLHSTIKENMK